MLVRTAFAILFAGCASGATLEASRGAVKLDGVMDEPAWLQTPTTGPWKGDKVVAFTEARVLYDGDGLVVGLYMSDENIGPSDVVEVRMGDERRAVHPGDTNVHVEDDEEWTAEVRFPRCDGCALELSRTDTPRGGEARTSRWSGRVRLKP